MTHFSKHWQKIAVAAFFLLVFFLVIVPLKDPDIWFHVKSGELMSERGIFFTDVFSFSAYGRAWAPYEWLFQVGVYWVQTLFGFEFIKYVMAAIVTVQIGIMYAILRRILRLSRIASCIFSFFYLVSVFEFFTARPQVPAYTFLLVNLFLILDYTLNGKNRLWLTIPITLLWTNLHGSIIVDVGLFSAYAGLSLINYRIHRDGAWMKKFWTLTVFTALTIILTVLPPLGTLQYRLLWRFFLDRNIIAQFIDEWGPLINNEFVFLFFSGTFALSGLAVLIAGIRKKAWDTMLWILPFLVFPVAAYSASRNVALGYITITIMLAWSLKDIHLQKLGKPLRILFWTAATLFIGFNIWILYLKKLPVRGYFPVYATQFIKQAHLQGNMFNEYGAGGYLLYHLYPDEKVFYDGRTDVYLARELPDTLNLALKKNLPDDQYKKVVYTLFDKYHISYVLLRSEKHIVVRKIGRILQADSANWSLVFWDDDSQLFIKRDGKNDAIIREYGVHFATPYNQDPFPAGDAAQALPEYLHMISVVDSAKSRNAVGYMYLMQGKINEAKTQFEKAITLDAGNESPYMNLAEIATHDGDLTHAISLYEKARSLAPDRGLVYIRLGELLAQNGSPAADVRAIWQQGLINTVDTDAKATLQKLLASP